MLESSIIIKEKIEEATFVARSEKLKVHELFETPLLRVNLLALRLNNYLVKLKLDGETPL